MEIDNQWYQRPAGVPDHAAAGGVVARLDSGGEILIALAREEGHDTPVLPKGHLRPGEEPEAAARREIAEETGVADLELLADMGVRERLNFKRTEWKTTHYYLYGARGEASAPADPKHPPPLWVPLDQVPELFWPEQGHLVAEWRGQIRALVTAWSGGGGAGQGEAGE